jgi:hypothetical protein
MNLDTTQIMTFGDVRRSIINDIAAVRRKELSVSEATAMGSLYKELHANVQCEINAAKLALQTEDRANSFGKIVQMGRRRINGDDDAAPSLA